MKFSEFFNWIFLDKKKWLFSHLKLRFSFYRARTKRHSHTRINKGYRKQVFHQYDLAYRLRMREFFMIRWKAERAAKHLSSWKRLRSRPVHYLQTQQLNLNPPRNIIYARVPILREYTHSVTLKNTFFSYFITYVSEATSMKLTGWLNLFPTIKMSIF